MVVMLLLAMIYSKEIHNVFTSKIATVIIVLIFLFFMATSRPLPFGFPVTYLPAVSIQRIRNRQSCKSMALYFISYQILLKTSMILLTFSSNFQHNYLSLSASSENYFLLVTTSFPGTPFPISHRHPVTFSVPNPSAKDAPVLFPIPQKESDIHGKTG